MTPIPSIRGSVGTVVILPIIVGMVIMFVGIFTLNTIEPLFDVTECGISNADGSPQIQLNGTDNESALQNYTIPTIYAASCTLRVNLLNISAQGGTLTAYEYPGSTAVATITDPDSGSSFFTVTPTSNAVYALNYTYIGDGDLNVTTNSYVRCCTSIVYQQTPGGVAYPTTTAAIGTAFAVFGLVLVIFGLASAIGSLRSMM